MTNKEEYRKYLQHLAHIYNANEAAVITDWVFEKVATLQRADIIKNPGQALNREIVTHLAHCLEALLQHKPVQYVLGEAWFYKMKLKVNEQVLIPRPETEELVQLVVNSCQKSFGKQQASKGSIKFQEGSQPPVASEPVLILDIGTGSGCIAIAVKKNLPGIIMHAIDVSAGALSVAQENATDQQVDIRFSEIDFLDSNNWNDMPVFDIIISNPPYIPITEKDKLDKKVTAYEPHGALFVPDNAPLLFYEKIAAFGKTHLSHKGEIYVEIHEDFSKETTEVFEQSYRVEIRKDMLGKERILTAVK